MRIISRKALRQFWAVHEDAESPLKAWFAEVKKAAWQSWPDIKQRYPSASSVGNDRYVFNIKGNKYRLITLINFIAGIVFIRFVGTHEEYDKVDAKEV